MMLSVLDGAPGSVSLEKEEACLLAAWGPVAGHCCVPQRCGGLGGFNGVSFVLWKGGVPTAKRMCKSSRNHRMAWVDKDHNDHLAPTPLLCAIVSFCSSLTPVTFLALSSSSSLEARKSH